MLKKLAIAAALGIAAAMVETFANVGDIGGRMPKAFTQTGRDLGRLMCDGGMERLQHQLSVRINYGRREQAGRCQRPMARAVTLFPRLSFGRHVLP